MCHLVSFNNRNRSKGSIVIKEGNILIKEGIIPNLSHLSIFKSKHGNINKALGNKKTIFKKCDAKNIQTSLISVFASVIQQAVKQ